MARRRYKKRKAPSRKGKVLKLSNRQAKTKAYDSRIEKVIARVARQEVQKGALKLVYRQYLFGPYDISTNTFTLGTRCHFSGHVQALARIQKSDGATAVRVIAGAQPYQTPATWVDPGTNVIAPITGMDGFRMGDWIKIHGFSLSLRLQQDKVAMALPDYEHAYVYWKICSTYYVGSDATDAAPDAEDLLTLPRFGFTSKLDSTLVTDKLEKKTRTHARGKIKMRISSLQTNVAFMNRYIDLSNKPLKVEYAALDQNGANVIRFKPFLVIRCSIPNTVAGQPYQPLLHACTKVHYVDS